MKTLIFSDVHGNLPALEFMLANEPNCQGYICLGDVVNYGPWSNECVELIDQLENCTVLMGNHEEAFLQGYYPANNDLVKSFFEKTFSTFNRFKTIKNYTDHIEVDSFKCKHTINNKYIYPDTKIELNNNYIIGHSHHQFQYKNGPFELFNAGSVGQNRQYINIINYLIYDHHYKKIFLKELKYDVDLIINEMASRKYPKQCIDYYQLKKRKL